MIVTQKPLPNSKSKNNKMQITTLSEHKENADTEQYWEMIRKIEM